MKRQFAQKAKVFLFLAFVFMTFQNCSQTGFEPDSLQNSIELPSQSEDSEETNSDNSSTPTPIPNPVPTPDPIPIPDPTPTPTPITLSHIIPQLAYLPASLGPRIINNTETAKPCEAPSGNKCIYVRAGAASGGNGTLNSPLNNLSLVNSIINGGDFVYLSGHFMLNKNSTLKLTNKANGVSINKMTVIKTLPGEVRAILDGQDFTMGLINLSETAKFIRIANVEITNSIGRGLEIQSAGETNIIEDCYINNTQGDTSPGSTPQNTEYSVSFGVGGGFFANSIEDNAILILRNNFFEKNNLLWNPGTNTMGRSDRNNMGALSINSEMYANQGSATLKIYNNVFNDEASGVRHKHPGHIVTEVYDNLFINSLRGVFIRSFKDNIIHHNVFYNISGGAVHAYNENTKGDLQAHVYNNNLFNSQLISNMPWPGNHKAFYEISNNFIHNHLNNNIPTINLSPVNNSDITFDQNLFLVSNLSRLMMLSDGNSLNQWVEFNTFNSQKGGTNISGAPISNQSTDLENHNRVYLRELNNLKSKNIGAFR